MPDTISLFTCGDTEPGSAGFLFLLLCPSFLGLSKPPPYPERDFYPVLHTFLQDKGLFLEALQITCQVQFQRAWGSAAYQGQSGHNDVGDIGVCRVRVKSQSAIP